VSYRLSVEDGKTARRQDGKTARRQDGKTARRQDGKDENKSDIQELIAAPTPLTPPDTDAYDRPLQVHAVWRGAVARRTRDVM
jgi:hypothetical protein